MIIYKKLIMYVAKNIPDNLTEDEIEKEKYKLESRVDGEITYGTNLGYDYNYDYQMKILDLSRADKRDLEFKVLKQRVEK